MATGKIGPKPILLGSSGWSYPDWEGPFYPEGMDSSDYLEWYAGHFPVVEVDSTFYRPPTPRMVRGWAQRTPDDFKFVLKVPRVITHEKLLRDCREEVEGFVASILPLGKKLWAALLQMGYFNRGMFAGQEAFLEALDVFLTLWPIKKIPLAVEIRNPQWVNDAFLKVLRRHGAALTLTEQKWMPTPAQIIERFDPVTGPLSVVRLLGDREATEKITQRWDKVVVDKTRELTETVGVLNRLAERVPVAVFVSNHYAGHSPATLSQLRRFLGQDEPEPPPRPKTLLF